MTPQNMAQVLHFVGIKFIQEVLMNVVYRIIGVINMDFLDIKYINCQGLFDAL